MGVAMRIVILIVLNGFFSSIRAARDYGLKEVVNDVSILARLTNGLSIQSELSRNPAQFSPIVSELLGIGSDALLDTLLAFPATNVSTELNTLFDAIANAQISAVDTVQVGSKINALTAMTTKTEDLAAGMEATSVTTAKTNFDAAYRKVHFSVFEERGLAKFVLALDLVMNEEHNGIASEVVKHVAALQAMKDSLTTFKQVFMKIGNKQVDNIDKLWVLKDALASLKPMAVVSEVARTYHGLQTIGTLSDDLLAMKTDINNLEGVLTTSQKSANGPQLSAVLKELDSNSKMIAGHSLTPGLPNGVADVQLIFKNDAWMKKQLGDGKSIEKLTSSMSVLKKFSSELKKLKTSWDSVTANSMKSTDTIAQLLTKMEEAGRGVTEMVQLADSIDKMGGCFNNLKPIAQLPNLEKFGQWLTKLEAFDGKLRTFEADIDAIAKSEFFAKLNNLDALTNIFGTNLQPSPDYIFAMLKSFKEIDSIRGISDLVVTSMKKLNKKRVRSIETFVNTKIDWTLVESVRKVLDGTGLSDALTCIKDLNFNSQGAAAYVKFADNTRSIQSKPDQVNETKTFLNDLAAVVTSGNAAKSSINQRPTRLRRNTPKTLDKHFVNELGVGVQVLRNMVDVLERKDMFKQLTTLSAVVETAIAAVSRGKDVWTDANKLAMKKLMTDVVGLDTFTRGLPNKDLETIWKVFDKAAEVPGVPVDSKLFSDPIAKNLVRNPSSDVQTAGTSFQTISTLQLDFAASRVYVRVASLSLNPVRAFFDELLENASTTEAQQSANPAATSGSDNTALLIILGIFCGITTILVLAGGYMYFRLWKALKEKQKEAKTPRTPTHKNQSPRDPEPPKSEDIKSDP